MIKAIAKNIALATCLALGASFGANAQNAESLKDYKFSCSSGSTFFAASNPECESFEVVYLEDNLEELNSEPSQNEIAQSRRRRRTGKYYAGFTGGVFFASGDAGEDGELNGVNLSAPGYGTAFGGSIFGGLKFNKIINAELELFLAFGGVDTDDLDDSLDEVFDGAAGGSDITSDTDADYSVYAIFAGPKFEFNLSQTGRSATVFVSPGLGLAITNISVEPSFSSSNASEQQIIDDQRSADPDAFDEEDASQTGIGFQIKAGGTFPIGRNLSVIGQTRYAILPTEDDFDSINLFSLEGGLQFKF